MTTPIELLGHEVTTPNGKVGWVSRIGGDSEEDGLTCYVTELGWFQPKSLTKTGNFDIVYFERIGVDAYIAGQFVDTHQRREA